MLEWIAAAKFKCRRSPYNWYIVPYGNFYTLANWAIPHVTDIQAIYYHEFKFYP